MTWVQARLKDLCVDAGQYGLNIAADSYSESGTRLIRTSDIESDGSLRSEGVYVDIPLEARHVLRPGDLLLSRSGTLGRTFLTPAAAEGATFAGYLVRFRPRRDIEPRFLSYLASSRPFQDAIRADAVASTIQNFNAERYANIRVRVPSFEEQQRIADLLDAELAQIRGILSLRGRQLATLRERRFALIRQVLTEGHPAHSDRQSTGLDWLPECPSHWRVLPLKRLVRCLDGQRIPLSAEQRSGRSGDYPYYGASSIVDWINDFIFDEPLVLLGEDGAQLGNPLLEVASYVEGKVWVNNHAHVLRPDKIDGRFLAHVLNVFDRETCMSGSTREKITQDAMGNIQIPVPPREEQAGVRARMDDLLSANLRLQDLLEQQIRLLEHRAQVVIAAAVTGGPLE